MKVCPRCKENKSFEDFHKDRGTKTGFKSYCKPCHKVSSGDRTQYLKNRNSDRLDFLAEIKLLRGCVDCGYKEHAVALDFDHRDGKIRAVSQLRSGNLDRLMVEIEKCDVVCANCHRVRTAQRGGWHGYKNSTT